MPTDLPERRTHGSILNMLLVYFRLRAAIWRVRRVRRRLEAKRKVKMTTGSAAMLESIKGLWREARGGVLRKEFLDLTRRLPTLNEPQAERCGRFAYRSKADRASAPPRRPLKFRKMSVVLSFHLDIYVT
jgi:hypothetical protein